MNRDWASASGNPFRLPPIGVNVGIVVYALAMAYLEAAVVVYLRAAIGVPTGRIFPIDLSPAAMPYGWIEVGREAATLVMIGAVAWIAGRSPLEPHQVQVRGQRLTALGSRQVGLDAWAHDAIPQCYSPGDHVTALAAQLWGPRSARREG